jgi:hypothetical protein
MLELFIIGSICGYFLPYITFPGIAVGLYLKYKGGNAKLQELQVALWKKVSDVQILGKLVTMLSPREEKQETTEDFFSSGGFIPANTAFVPAIQTVS